MAAKKEKIAFYGTGRRKKSIARVRLVSGNGNITINNKALDEFSYKGKTIRQWADSI